MKLIDAYRISRSNLFRAKSRSFLTILGVAVGVGAIVMLVSLGIGLQKLTVEQIATIDVLTTLNVTNKENTQKVLDKKALEEIRDIDKVVGLSPTLKFPAQFTYNETTTSAIIQGIKSEGLEIENVNLEEGRGFLDGTEEIIITKSLLKTLGEDETGNSLEKNLKAKIFPVEDTEVDISKETKVIEEDLRIVGVDSDETLSLVYVSLDWLQEKCQSEKIELVAVKVQDRGDIDQVRDRIEKMGFEVATISDLIKQVDTVFLIFEIVLGAIGGIGLFVAAIGIINTMTIALLERTHEVGVMKALGAANKDVRRLFVYEALQIAFLGGILGVVLGFALGQFFNLAINLIIELSGGTQTIKLFITPFSFALIMVAFSLFVGWLTGLYPARRASKLSPLEALHVE